MIQKYKVLLMILDGWGIGDGSKSDVISQVPTPFMDYLTKTYPNSQLLACGEDVGLPKGQMGNSEVGHLNIGAGRIVYQDLVKINRAIDDNSITSNLQIVKAYNYVKTNNKQLHLVGLLSNGGVHSLHTHLYKLCDIAKQQNLKDVYVHALTDGRDTDPKSGFGFINDFLKHIKKLPVKLASVIGRYYGMDRDNNFDRIKKAYDMMLYGIGQKTTDILQSIKDSYKDGVTDEFIKPIVHTDNNGVPITKIKEGDVVICFNFRTDRLRQLTRVFTQENHPENNMKTIPLEWYTMTNYDDKFKNIHVIYGKENVHETLGEIISDSGLKQIRTAETEKYAHVTFFFSGGREQEFKNEKRILIPSPKVATYDLKPEMSAPIVTERIIKEIKKGDTDFICLNFANGDMVGHTGVYEAISKAIIAVDSCVKKVVNAASQNGYITLIIADHGNADHALNKDGSPNTAHSLNPVPCILVNNDKNFHLKNGILADVAPTILKIIGIPKPKIMTGKPLF